MLRYTARAFAQNPPHFVLRPLPRATVGPATVRARLVTMDKMMETARLFWDLRRREPLTTPGDSETVETLRNLADRWRNEGNFFSAGYAACCALMGAPCSPPESSGDRQRPHRPRRRQNRHSPQPQRRPAHRQSRRLPMAKPRRKTPLGHLPRPQRRHPLTRIPPIIVHPSSFPTQFPLTRRTSRPAAPLSLVPSLRPSAPVTLRVL